MDHITFVANQKVIIAFITGQTFNLNNFAVDQGTFVTDLSTFALDPFAYFVSFRTFANSEKRFAIEVVTIIGINST